MPEIPLPDDVAALPLPVLALLLMGGLVLAIGPIGGASAVGPQGFHGPEDRTGASRSQGQGAGGHDARGGRHHAVTLTMTPLEERS